jgi:hypothetical protein
MSVMCLILRNQAGLAVTFLMYPEQLKQVRFIIKILIIVGHYVSDVFDIKKSVLLPPLKMGCHDIAEILLKVALNTINQPTIQL